MVIIHHFIIYKLVIVTDKSFTMQWWKDLRNSIAVSWHFSQYQDWLVHWILCSWESIYLITIFGQLFTHFWSYRLCVKIQGIWVLKSYIKVQAPVAQIVLLRRTRFENFWYNVWCWSSVTTDFEVKKEKLCLPADFTLLQEIFGQHPLLLVYFRVHSSSNLTA